jgi:hypothetical protein
MKMKFKSRIVIVIAFAFVLSSALVYLLPEHANAGTCDSGWSILGSRKYHGYFTGVCDWGGTSVLPVRSDGQALPSSSINSVDSLIGLLRSYYNGGDAQERTGAEFIYHTMVGDNAGVSRNVSDSDWNNLSNTLKQLTIDWSGDVSNAATGINSYWQGTVGEGSDGTNNDDAFYYEVKSPEPGIAIYNSDGSIAYQLYRKCANPNGFINKIVPPDHQQQNDSVSLPKVVPSISTSFTSGKIMEGGNAVNNVTGKAQAVGGNSTYTNINHSYISVGSMYPYAYNTMSMTNFFNQWQVSKVIYGPNDDSYNNFGSVNQNNGQNPCSYYGGKSCQSFSSGSGSTLSSGSTFTNSTDNVSIDDLQSGSKVCYGMSVYNSGVVVDEPNLEINQRYHAIYTTTYYSDSKGHLHSYTYQSGVNKDYTEVLRPGSTRPNGQWAHSNLSCVVIGKKPKIQVQGGDLSTGRSTTSTSVNVDTLTSEKNNTLYGSWAEYAMYIAGKVDGMASGNYLRNGEAISGLSNNQKNMIVNNISICQYSPLTFSNLALLSSATSSSIRTASCDDSVSPGMKAGYALSTASPDVSASFAATNNVGGGVDLNSLSSGVYNAGNISVSGSNIPTGKSIIIKSTGKVTITGDIKTQLDNVSSIDQISQIIIIANEIDIDEGVQRVDSWLVAKTSGETGILNTCDKYASSADSVSQLNANDCSKQLTINGPVAADKVYFFRTAGSEADSDSNISAEIFNLPATTFLWSKAREKGSASGSESTVTTVYQTEKPVRY